MDTFVLAVLVIVFGGLILRDAIRDGTPRSPDQQWLALGFITGYLGYTRNTGLRGEAHTTGENVMSVIGEKETPIPGVVYRLTGEKSIASGNSLEESRVNPIALVNVKALNVLVASVGKAVSRRTSLPVLLTAVVSIGHRSITLRTTDLEIGIEGTIPTEAHMNEVPGELCVPWKWLKDTLKTLPKDLARIEIELKPSVKVTVPGAVGGGTPPKCILRAPGLTFVSDGIAVTDMPPSPDFKAHHDLKVSGQLFGKAIAAVGACASTDQTRPILTGIMLALHAADGELELVGTDANILGVRYVEAKGTAPDDFQVVLPGPVAKLPFGDGELIVQLNEQRTMVRFETPTLTIYSRLIDGSYPNFQQVIPTTTLPEVAVKVSDLVGAIKRVAVAAQDEHHIVRLAASPGDAVLTAKTRDEAEASEHIIAYVTGLTPDLKDPEVITAFSAPRMLRALSGFGSDSPEVRLHIRDPLTPIVLREHAGDRDLSVVMPIRIK